MSSRRILLSAPGATYLRRLLPILLLAGCGTGGEEPRATGAAVFGSEISSDAPGLFRLHCAMCHGPEGEGLDPLGPNLRDKGAHWNLEDLLAYLRDPAGYAAGVVRLGQRPMPALASSVTDEQARDIALYALSRMDRP